MEDQVAHTNDEQIASACDALRMAAVRGIIATDLELLQKIQWCVFNKMQGNYFCPVCKRPKGQHYPNCVISVRIAELVLILEAL